MQEQKRTFEFALNKNGEKQFPDAKLPEYQTENSAGADFFAAETIEVPSIFRTLICEIRNGIELGTPINSVKPTLIHTGIKAAMPEDEVLEIYNRSSNPGKKGLVLANSVGIVDSDYYNNPDNDGEIMFGFYNFSPETVTINKGDRIGQGIFKKFLRPNQDGFVKNEKRKGGFGSTDNL